MIRFFVPMFLLKPKTAYEMRIRDWSSDVCSSDLAKRFAEEGAKVVIGDLNEEMAKGVVAEIRAAGGDALFIRLDVTDAASWNNAIAAAVEAFGGLTTLSYTAGIIHPGGFEEESKIGRASCRERVCEYV